jgi:hypothetical protein
MNSLLYLAYGPSDICSEAIYSILSYNKVAQESLADIYVYTDSPEAFQKVLGEQKNVYYPAISPGQWQAWQGSRVYLLKIAVLEHAAANYPGNLLFVDTDTIWMRDPAPVFHTISQGQRFMHVCEGTLAHGNHLSRKIYRHLRGKQWQVGALSFRINEHTELYNSGIIGFSSPAVTVLPEVRELAEALYATYNKHLMEQLAFSMRFQVDGSIAEAAPYVLHYWNLKSIRPFLAQLFQKYEHRGPDELYKRATRLDIPRLHQEEFAYRNLPRWRRTMLKLLGRRWRLPKLEV